MKKRNAVLMSALLMATLLFSGCGTKNNSNRETNKSSNNTQVEATMGDKKEDMLKVYTSFYPMYDFTKKIGGDKVEVINLVPSGTEPHDWEPSPTDIASLKGADILVFNGAGMEHWIDKVLDSLGNTQLFLVEASHGLDLIKADHDYDDYMDDQYDKDTDDMEDRHEEDRHDEDIDYHEHGEFDPHLWLSPMLAKGELENIKNALVEKAPQHKDYFEANYEKYAQELDDLDQAYKMEIEKVPVEKRNIVVSHEAYGYLCKTYGLTQLGIQGISAELEPDAKRMVEITEFVKANNVKVIFTEELLNTKIADTIAKETGAKVLQLNPVEGLTKEQLDAGEDYFSIMRMNLEALMEAFE